MPLIQNWLLSNLSKRYMYQIMYDLHPGFSRSSNTNKVAFEFSAISKVTALD